MLREFLRAAERAGSAPELLGALRDYLVRRLRLAPGAVTYGDFAAGLSAHAVPEEALRKLAAVLTQLESASYAGQSQDLVALRGEAASAASELEGYLQ